MIILSGQPLSTNSIYRKRKGFGMYMTPEGHAKKEQYQWEATTQWKKEASKKNLEVIVTLYFGDKRVHDIDNYTKILFDSFTGIVWIDDKQIQRMTVEKFIDKENPHIEVEVFEL